MQTSLTEFDKPDCPICQNNLEVQDYHGGAWGATHSCMYKRHPRIYFHRGHHRKTCYISKVMVHKELMLVCRNEGEERPRWVGT